MFYVPLRLSDFGFFSKVQCVRPFECVAESVLGKGQVMDVRKRMELSYECAVGPANPSFTYSRWSARVVQGCNAKLAIVIVPSYHVLCVTTAKSRVYVSGQQSKVSEAGLLRVEE